MRVIPTSAAALLNWNWNLMMTMMMIDYDEKKNKKQDDEWCCVFFIVPCLCISGIPIKIEMLFQLYCDW
jgi:hypothetical protein